MVALLVVAILHRPTRLFFPRIVQAFAQPAILTVFTLFFVWLAAGIYLAHLGGAWAMDLLSETILWAIVAGVPLLFNLDNASKDGRWILHQWRGLLSATVLFGFLVNAQTFGLALEILLQGLLGFLVILGNYAQFHPEHRLVAQTVNGVLSLTAIGLAIAGTVYLASEWQSIDWIQTARSVAMPIWLGAWAALMIAALGIYSNVERIFRLMGLKDPRRSTRLWRILPLAVRVGWDHGRIRRCGGYWYNNMATATGIRGANAVVTEFLQRIGQEDAWENAAVKKLEDNAGATGVDENGAQLDQREFKATWDALDTVLGWFHGWYGKNVSGYDLAKVAEIGQFHEFKELPAGHGINIAVSPDRQSCFAARRTVSGHVLAVGMCNNEYAHWRWDGEGFPQGFPGQGGDWGTEWRTRAINPNW